MELPHIDCDLMLLIRRSEIGQLSGHGNQLIDATQIRMNISLEIPTEKLSQKMPLKIRSRKFHNKMLRRH